MMEVLLREGLSLEAGAAYLTQLLRQAARENLASSPLRERALEWIEGADLQLLFTEQALKEDWKYTPMDFLRQPWTLQPFEEKLSLSEQVAPLAIESFPIPKSPWEALLVGAPVHRHIMLASDTPLHIALRNLGGLALELITVQVPAGARREIQLSIEGTGLSLVRLHLHIEEGAQVRFYYPSEGAEPKSYRYLIFTAHVEGKASLHTYALTTGTGWKRDEVRVFLAGKEAAAYLHGAASIAEGGVVDTAVRVEHAAPHTESNQLFRSLVEAGGRSTFQGRIYVARSAQKTNAYQSHKALLTATTAAAYSRPQLEIFADDVRCTHGVSTGFLQGEMLLYLRTRGIPESLARQMIYGAFLAEVVEKIPSEALRRWAEAKLLRM
ncbi:MAG: SufD family Fe-S cluster assembly protein [Bacteroidia bacterium]|nr:SufD family Fe-S cluster assembly protein [Bacteroidia bacterium]